MYAVATEILDSPIEGRGVFSLEKIYESKIVWIFKDGYDTRVTEKAFAALPN